MVELRVDLGEDHPFFAVADALCQADPRKSRSSITRSVLYDWAMQEIDRSNLVMRTAGAHASAAESKRKQGG